MVFPFESEDQLYTLGGSQWTTLKENMKRDNVHIHQSLHTVVVLNNPFQWGYWNTL